jgi:hypothetical protein
VVSTRSTISSTTRYWTSPTAPAPRRPAAHRSQPCVRRLTAGSDPAPRRPHRTAVCARKDAPPREHGHTTRPRIIDDRLHQAGLADSGLPLDHQHRPRPSLSSRTAAPTRPSSAPRPTSPSAEDTKGVVDLSSCSVTPGASATPEPKSSRWPLDPLRSRAHPGWGEPPGATWTHRLGRRNGDSRAGSAASRRRWWGRSTEPVARVHPRWLARPGRTVGPRRGSPQLVPLGSPRLGAVLSPLRCERLSSAGRGS